MKKLLIGTGVAGIAVVALGAGSLIFTDKQIDNMVAQVEQTVSQPVTMTVLEDDNSLLHRQLNLVLAMDDGETQFKVIIENAIEKRPWGTSIQHIILMDDGFAKIDSNDEIKQLLTQYFVDQPFVTGTTNVSFSGNYQSTFLSKSVNESLAEGSLALSPFELVVTGNLTGDLTMNGSWAGMSMVNNDLQQSSVLIKPMQVSAVGELYNNSVFLGKQILSGEGMEFVQTSEWQNQRFTMAPFSFVSSGELADEHFSGLFTAALEGFNYEDDDNSLDVKNINTSISISGIEASNYKKLVDGLNEMQVSGVPSDALMGQASTLLRNGFVIEMNDWVATVDDQNIAFGAALVIPENDVADVSNLFSLMGLFANVKANANLQFDQGLADVPVLHEPLLALLTSGVMINDDTQYRMDFSLENGIALLNKEPLPLPF